MAIEDERGTLDGLTTYAESCRGIIDIKAG